MGRKKGKVSIYSLAKEFGCTPSTVSKAFANSTEVSDSLRRRIHARADELNFRPHSTRRRAQNLCALVCMGEEEELRLYGYLEPVIQGIHRFCREKGLEFSLFAETRKGLESINLAKELRHRNADCAVVLGAGNEEKFLSNLKKNRMPYACVYDGSAGQTVTVDNREAGRLAANYLLQMGHSRLAIATGEPQRESSKDRCRGFEEGANAQGSAAAVSVLSPQAGLAGEEWGGKILDDWLEGGRPFTALFTLGENIALGFLSQCAIRRVHVPSEISVITCDNLPASSVSAPPLTTVRIPNRRAGYAAAEWTWKSLNEDRDSVDTVVLPVSELVTRSSVAAPSK